MGKTIRKKLKESVKKPNQRLVNVDKGYKEKVVIYDDISYEELKEAIEEENALNLNLFRVRIFETNLRVTDFSFCNCVIDDLEDRILFKFSFKGHPLNWVYFNSNSELIVNNKNNTIEVKVKGPVYWADGTRRYDNRINHDSFVPLFPIFCKEDIEEAKIQEGNTDLQKEKKFIRRLIEIFNEDFVYEDD